MATPPAFRIARTYLHDRFEDRLMVEGRSPISPRIGAVLVCAALLASTSALAGAAVPFGPPQQSDTQLPDTQPGDPFLRTGPEAQPPTLANPGSAPTPTGTAGFGVPRFYSSGGSTRVVFDLPAGLRYTLTPTFSGLRLDVQGAAGITLLAQHQAAPGSAVSDYSMTLTRAGGAQLLLQTPFPLGGAQGWTAGETTIASGGRVLILNFGAALAGGAEPGISGNVQDVAGPAVPGSPSANIPHATDPSTPGDQSPPGDNAAPLGAGTLPTATPALSGRNDSTRIMQGLVSGISAGTQKLSAPRIGKNPGLTRVVFDLPPGTSFRITPLPLGLRIDLSGVSAPDLGADQFGAAKSQSSQVLTPEMRGLSFSPNLTGSSVTLLTASAITLRSGWRNVLLPPASGSQLSRLAIDLSPALADTTPLGTLALAPVRSAKSSMLAFSGAPNRPRVVLDPGHGGSDPGAIGQVVEKAVTLDVARRIRSDLQGAGIDVIMTRDSDTALNADKNTDLKLRANLGTGVAQMFVSIHVNSTEASSALRGYGIETWWNPNNPNSQALAQSIQQDAITATAAYSRGLKNYTSLAVLRESHIPAALVEIGYTSHPIDGQNLSDTNYLDRVAYGVASGIRDALQAGLGANWR